MSPTNFQSVTWLALNSHLNLKEKKKPFSFLLDLVRAVAEV
jgi:hypothetical protein